MVEQNLVEVTKGDDGYLFVAGETAFAVRTAEQAEELRCMLKYVYLCGMTDAHEPNGSECVH